MFFFLAPFIFAFFFWSRTGRTALFLQVEVRTILSHVALLHLEVLTVQEMPGVALSVLTTMSLPCSRSTEDDLLFQKHFSSSFCDTVSKQNYP